MSKHIPRNLLNRALQGNLGPPKPEVPTNDSYVPGTIFFLKVGCTSAPSKDIPGVVRLDEDYGYHSHTSLIKKGDNVIYLRDERVRRLVFGRKGVAQGYGNVLVSIFFHPATGQYFEIPGKFLRSFHDLVSDAVQKSNESVDEEEK